MALQWWLTPLSCTWLRICLERRQLIAYCAFTWAIISQFKDVFLRRTIPTYCRISSCCGPPDIRPWLFSTYTFCLTSLLAYSSCLTSLISGSFQVQWLLLCTLQSPSQTFLGFAVVTRTLSKTLSCCKTSPAFSSHPAHLCASADLYASVDLCNPTKASRSCKKSTVRDMQSR